MNNDFNFFVPLDEKVIEKATKLPASERYNNMVLEGVASDDSEDIEEEILEPAGYVTNHFLNGGYINYEHLAKRSPKFIIGEPTFAEVKGNKFFIKAKLWPNSEVARDAWDKIIEMKESGSKRRPGWSIEGKALVRDPMNPKRIKKALITNCALTFAPVNGNTYADIVKGVQKEDYVDPIYDVDTEEKEFIFEFEQKGKKYRVGKDFKVYEVIKKSMDIAATKPLIPESLDKKVKNIALSEIKKSLDNVLGNKLLMQSNPILKSRLREIFIKF
jgi:hypothetical protein